MKQKRVLPATLTGAAVVLILTAAANAQIGSHAQHHPAEQANSMLKTPAAIAAEHRELHETLDRASNEDGPLGATARKLEHALAPHFRREEEIATPPLGLLPSLASGEATAQMRAVLPMTQALERELPQMLKEHQAIRAAAGEFRKAGEAAGRTEYVRFADQLASHARQEEEILYPAAVLVGRYVARTAPN